MTVSHLPAGDPAAPPPFEFQPLGRVVFGADGESYPGVRELTVLDLDTGKTAKVEGVPADFRICSLLHVSSVEPLGPAASGARQTGTP